MKGSIESAAKKALSSLTQRREVKTWQNRYFWIEQSPEIKGEYLVELTEGGEKNILISGDFAPGNSVHEYGGGDYCIAAEGDIYFVCQKDQQIYLFNNAKVIIGAHGAAFANLAFCKKNAKINIRTVEHSPSSIKEIFISCIEFETKI